MQHEAQRTDLYSIVRLNRTRRQDPIWQFWRSPHQLAAVMQLKERYELQRSAVRVLQSLYCTESLAPAGLVNSTVFPCSIASRQVLCCGEGA